MVDKFYLMLPEFRVKRDLMDKKGFLKAFEESLDFKPERDKLLMAYDMVINGSIAFEEGSLEMKMYDFYTEIEYIKYDYDKPARENTVQQRNNQLINMIWGVLTNPDTVDKQLNPGNFDKAKIAARIMSIANNATPKELEKLLGTKDYLKKLKGMSLDELNRIADIFIGQMNPLSPVTQMFFHDQNATGGKMIGIYANHNVSHAMAQHTKLGCDAFTVNGTVYSSLHDIKNSLGHYITRNISNFLAASVDNVKDPVLRDLMQNPESGDITCFLLRAGVEPVEVGLIMNQPIVKEMLRAFKEHPFTDRKILIQRIVSTWSKKRNWTTSKEDTERYSKLYSEDLFSAILYEKSMDRNTDFSRDTEAGDHLTKGKRGWYNFQIAVGNTFQEMYETASDLSTLTQIMRADTSNGAAGPGIANTLAKINRITSFMDSLDNSTLHNADIVDFHVPKDNEDIYMTVMDSELPFVEAFTIAGLGGTMKLMSKHFPFFRTSIYDAIFDRNWGIASYTKKGQVSAKIIEQALNDITVYALMKTDFFNSYINDKGEMISGLENRREFIFEFPHRFRKILEENPDIAANRFISRLRLSYPRKNSKKDPPNTRIVFRNSGRLSTIQRDMYTRDWLSLLFSENPKAVQLGIDLFKYDMFQGGLGFGPNSFGHLASVLLRKAVPGYEETLRGLFKRDDYSAFVRQFILNHMDMPQLVPQYTSSELKAGHTTLDGRFEIDPKAPGFTKKVVSVEGTNGETIVYNVPIPFFCRISENGTLSYYEADQPQFYEDQPFTYHLVQPLGFRGKVLEYEYGASDVKSVFYNIQRFQEGTEDSGNFEDGEQGLKTEEAAPYNSVEEIKVQAPDGVDGVSKPKDVSQYKPVVEADENGQISCGFDIEGIVPTKL